MLLFKTVCKLGHYNLALQLTYRTRRTGETNGDSVNLNMGRI